MKLLGTMCIRQSKNIEQHTNKIKKSESIMQQRANTATIHISNAKY